LSRGLTTSDLEQRLRSGLPPQYEVIGQLGEGGMAEVMRARDRKHDRVVAIKVLRPELGLAIGPQRFKREIAIVARLAHPHILPLLDSGEAGELLYYVMPLVEGESLRERLERDGQLPVDEAISLTKQVASALAHAHSHGVVHRDIKPENILLTGDQVLVADFGVASALEDRVDSRPGARLTATGIVVGTPEYMAPEQASGMVVDSRADQYALGCVLYEMLAGAPPFTGATAAAIIARHVAEEPPPVRSSRRTVPDGVDAALKRALSKVPADRFATVHEFAAALGGAQPVAPRRPAARRIRIGAGVAVLAAVGGALAWNAFVVPPLRLGPRDWVLVGDVQSPADDPELGRSMRELIVTGLNQSPVFSTVPAEQFVRALRNAELPESSIIDSRLARELAYRTSVRVIVTGSVSRLGRETYSVVLHAVGAEDGENLFSEATSADDDGDRLVRAVEDLVRRMRGRLGEHRSVLQAERPLIAVRTPSFAAFRRYAEGLDQVGRGNWGRSIEAFREAVALDSGFASAWAAMGSAWLTSRRPDSAAFAFRRALAHEDRMSTVERYRLMGDAAFHLRRDAAEAVRWYDLALTERPRSAPILNNRGIYLSAMGRHDEAVAALAAAAAVDPLMVGPRQIQLLNLAAELVVTGRLDSARRVAVRLTRGGAPEQYARLLLYAATDAWDSALVAAEPIAAGPSTEDYVRMAATGLHAAALAATGQTAAAAAVLRQAAAGARERLPEARWHWQALLFLADASGVPAGSAPDHVMRGAGPGPTLLRGLAAAASGRLREARQALAALRGAAPDSLRAIGWGSEYLAARIHAAAGEWDSARSIMGPVAAAGEHDPFSLDRPGSLQLRWFAAEAEARAGSLDSAARLLERVLEPTGLPPAHYAHRGIPQWFARRRLAEWYDQLGRVAEATGHRRAAARAESMGGTR
jgi:tetratricopeptide (TPR) repeat protein/tRNA A-37 threonylcarbamoyl transferase component Bud32